MNRRKLVGAIAVLSVAVFVGAAALYTPPRKQEPVMRSPDMETPLIRAYSPVLGPVDAPVTIVEFFDPACEACRAYYPFVKQIVAGFNGKVRVVLRYAAFHPTSEAAVIVLEAARLQGKFEPVLEALLQAQPQWAPHGRAPDNVWPLAERAGLDLERARQDQNDPRIAEVIAQDAADVGFLDVRQTPTFFVNGKALEDFGPQQLLDAVKREVESLR